MATVISVSVHEPDWKWEGPQWSIRSPARQTTGYGRGFRSDKAQERNESDDRLLGKVHRPVNG